MKITFQQRGDFNNIEAYLRGSMTKQVITILEKYGARGVSELANNTPVDTGETRNSWYYEVVKTPRGYTLSWNNSKMAGSVPLVVLIQYGHGTGSGAFIQGIDFINPALQPIFYDMLNDIWKEVT